MDIGRLPLLVQSSVSPLVIVLINVTHSMAVCVVSKYRRLYMKTLINSSFFAVYTGLAYVHNIPLSRAAFTPGRVLQVPHGNICPTG